MSDKKKNLEERINQFPILRDRIESILEIVEDASGDMKTAHKAEECVIEQLRNLGNEVMTEWASKKQKHKEKECKNKSETKGHGKKKVRWYTTYGEIEIEEAVFLEGGKLIRPFSNEAQVQNRMYSLPLQRRITDFGADDSFKKATQKLKEHYGITVPESSARIITEKHAEIIKNKQTLEDEIPGIVGSDIISEMDGGMIPIVDTEESDFEGEQVDKRKMRKIRWKEAKLIITRKKGEIKPVFGATTGSPDDAGNILLDCAIKAGVGENSHIHCVGDGAKWISDQVDRVFGTQADYLIDFYHLCEYLAPASKKCKPEAPEKWFEDQKNLLKTGQIEKVLEELSLNMESPSLPDNEAPVRCCHRYIRNRIGQFDYKKALDNDLPIGSGEVESAHRYVVQKRLKLPGAWWAEKNAENMLALRVLRENGGWEGYWKEEYLDAA